MKKYTIIALIQLVFAGLSFAQVTTTFNYTGSVQIYTVPACVNSITITALGAKGGGINGGNGATVTGTIAVIPGQILEIYVGGMGLCPTAGYNGGAAGATSSTIGNESCGGGGASDVRVTPYALANRIIVAAGGGGMGGGNTDAQAGVGGCANGANGTSPFGQGGFGASQIAGGAGGPPWITSGTAGSPGTLGVGGIGGPDPCFNLGPGGGGGGGYYGGGGGGSDCFGSGSLGGGGGGGGSSLTPTGGTCTAGNNNTNGQVTITATGGLVATFSPAAPAICVGQSIQIVASGGQTYSWSPAIGLSNTNNDTVVANPPATQIYSVIVQDTIGGCADTVSLTVTVNPYPVITFNPAIPAICVGSSIPITASGATSYIWSPATGLNTTIGANVIANPVATQTYMVSGTSAAGCTSDTVITVTVNPIPNLVFNPVNPSFCVGQNIQIVASGAISYNWSPALGLNSVINDTVLASPPATQIYTVIGTSGFGCADTSTITVTVNPLPVVNAGVDQIICNGSSIVLNGSSTGSTFNWTPTTGLTNPTTLTPTASPSSTITYTLTSTDANGCSNADAVTIIVPVVVAAFTASPLTGEPPLTVTFTNTSSPNAVTYNWNYGDGNSEVTTLLSTQNIFANAGVYVVTLIATDANGCSDTTSMTIIVEFPFSIIIPNVISPNGDGKNDGFEIISTGVKEMTVSIFDRWGIYIYGYTQLDGKWDGKRNGKECPDGTYYYIVKLTASNNEIKEYKGPLTILR